MNQIELTWWVAGGLVLIAVLYVLMLNMIPLMERINIRKVVKRTAKEENQEFLIENASYHNFAQKPWYWGLLLTVFSVVILLKYEEVYMEGQEETFFTIAVALIFFFSLLVHAAVGFIGLLWVVCSWGDEKRSTLHVRDFLKPEEVSLMKWVRHEYGEKSELDRLIEDDYRNEGSMGYWYVHMPDLMVSILKDRARLQKFVVVQRKLYEIENVDKALLTPEQVKRNEHFEQQFKESLEALVPHLKQILLATDKEYFKAEQKKKLDKVKIRQDFDTKQEEAERALMALNQAVQFEEKQEHPPVSEAIRELRRVAESELVSPELKKQASSLIDRIEEKQLQMRNQQETELVDGEALTIIRANELFFGLSETDISK